MAGIRRMLIVEDDPALRTAMARVVSESDAEIVGAASVAEALLRLEEAPPDLILLDVRLPDGSGLQVAEAASHLRPKPTVIAVSGGASPVEAFDLGRVGVSQFLPKPFTLDELQQSVETARRWVPCLEPFVAESVGKRELLDLVSDVRETMVDEALAKAEGSRSGAAKQLGVTRQAVQQIVQKRRRRMAAGEEPGG